MRKNISHTPDEARSVGLAKACVSYKIYSVIEKINYKFIILTVSQAHIWILKLISSTIDAK